MPLGGAAHALWVIYFIMIGVMGLSLYLSYAIKSSKFGLGLLAIGQATEPPQQLDRLRPLLAMRNFGRLSGDATGIGLGLNFARNFFEANRDAYGISPNEVSVVIIARHVGTPLMFNDHIWDKYGDHLVDRIKLFDPGPKPVGLGYLFGPASMTRREGLRGLALANRLRHPVERDRCWDDCNAPRRRTVMEKPAHQRVQQSVW